MRRWRKMTWAIIVFSGLMLVWIISAGTTSSNCSKEDQFKGACKAGEAAGRTIGIGLLVFLWFMGFVVLSLIWFMTRRRD